MAVRLSKRLNTQRSNGETARLIADIGKQQ